jgi:hypothetical protein
MERKSVLRIAGFFALCLLLLGPCSSAQEFKGLNQVRIVIEELNQDAKITGLSRETLESIVLVALKRDLPRLRTDNSARSYVYVNVTVGDPGAGQSIAFVSVELHRPVKVIRDDDSETEMVFGTTVWKKGDLLFGPSYEMASRVSDKIGEEITQLAADYYRQNTDK